MMDPVHDREKHNTEWTLSQMDAIPNGHHPKIHYPEWHYPE